jgi:hypothetical protein
MDVVAPTPHGAEVVSTVSHYARGLEGKDATLIEGMNNSHLHREVTRDVHVLAKDNQVATLENRFQAAMLAKDAELQSVRLAHENALVLAATKAELAAGVIADGEKTRDLIRAQAAADGAVSLADAKNEIIALKAKLGIV